MKTTRITSSVAVLLLLAALWSWHQREHPGGGAPRAELAGTWLTTGPDGGQRRVMIAPDGAMTVLIHGRTIGRMEGWSRIQNGFLIGIITNSSQPMPLPVTNEVRIVRMDAHELVLQADPKTQIVFKKVAP